MWPDRVKGQLYLSPSLLTISGPKGEMTQNIDILIRIIKTNLRSTSTMGLPSKGDPPSYAVVVNLKEGSLTDAADKCDEKQ